MLGRLFLGQLQHDERIAVSGWLEGDWICVRWEIANSSRSFVYPVDCRVDAKRLKLRQNDAKDMLFDFLGHFVGLFFKDRSEPFTGPKWESVTFAGKELWVRGQVRDERAESSGDKMLHRAAHGSPDDA